MAVTAADKETIITNTIHRLEIWIKTRKKIFYMPSKRKEQKEKIKINENINSSTK